jgi:hypothetical protein
MRVLIPFSAQSRYNSRLVKKNHPRVGFEGFSMSQPAYRLGDQIDDYCPRCRLLLNHAVASMVNGKVVKVVCATCHSEHPYREGEAPEKKKKVTGSRGHLFDQVLAKSAPQPPAPAAEPAPEPPAPKKKRTATAARYITRHKTRPPRGSAG